MQSLKNLFRIFLTEEDQQKASFAYKKMRAIYPETERNIHNLIDLLEKKKIHSKYLVFIKDGIEKKDLIPEISENDKVVDFFEWIQKNETNIGGSVFASLKTYKDLKKKLYNSYLYSIRLGSKSSGDDISAGISYQPLVKSDKFVAYYIQTKEQSIQIADYYGRFFKQRVGWCTAYPDRDNNMLAHYQRAGRRFIYVYYINQNITGENKPPLDVFFQVAYQPTSNNQDRITFSNNRGDLNIDDPHSVQYFDWMEKVDEPFKSKLIAEGNKLRSETEKTSFSEDDILSKIKEGNGSYSFNGNDGIVKFTQMKDVVLVHIDTLSSPGMLNQIARHSYNKLIVIDKIDINESNRERFHSEAIKLIRAYVLNCFARIPKYKLQISANMQESASIAHETYKPETQQNITLDQFYFTISKVGEKFVVKNGRLAGVFYEEEIACPGSASHDPFTPGLLTSFLDGIFQGKNISYEKLSYSNEGKLKFQYESAKEQLKIFNIEENFADKQRLFSMMSTDSQPEAYEKLLEFYKESNDLGDYKQTKYFVKNIFRNLDLRHRERFFLELPTPQLKNMCLVYMHNSFAFDYLVENKDSIDWINPYVVDVFSSIFLNIIKESNKILKNLLSKLNLNDEILYEYISFQGKYDSYRHSSDSRNLTILLWSEIKDKKNKGEIAAKFPEEFNIKEFYDKLDPETEKFMRKEIDYIINNRKGHISFSSELINVYYNRIMHYRSTPSSDPIRYITGVTIYPDFKNPYVDKDSGKSYPSSKMEELMKSYIVSPTATRKHINQNLGLNADDLIKFVTDRYNKIKTDFEGDGYHLKILEKGVILTVEFEESLNILSDKYLSKYDFSYLERIPKEDYLKNGFDPNYDRELIKKTIKAVILMNKFKVDKSGLAKFLEKDDKGNLVIDNFISFAQKYSPVPLEETKALLYNLLDYLIEENVI